MKKIALENIVWKEGKYYVSQCLNVDVSSFGKTKKKALKNLDEALELYFEDIKTPKVVKMNLPALTHGVSRLRRSFATIQAALVRNLPAPAFVRSSV